jgi:hypothetical protein
MNRKTAVKLCNGAEDLKYFVNIPMKSMNAESINCSAVLHY